MRVPYASSRSPLLPVEVLTRGEIEARLGPGQLGRPELVDFHLILVPTGTGGHHLVDFQPVPIALDRIITVRPGQVMAWDTEHRADALAVLAQPWVVVRTWLPGDPTSTTLSATERATAVDLIGILRREQDHYDAAPGTGRVMTAVFAALEAVLDKALHAAPPTPRDHEPATAYRRLIEQRIGSGTIVHNVADLTTTLPWSTRTIARATSRTLALTPKQLLDRRLLLEAQRRLAHTDDSITSIARALGFADHTNFHRFFERVGQERPNDFRRRHRPTRDLAREQTL